MLHLAAGIIVAVIAVEIMPRGLGIDPPWIMVLFFVLGGLFFVAIDWRSASSRSGQESGGVWLIYVAVSMDLLSDGFLICTGSTIGFGLAFLLALGQVIADVPEGFATIANLRQGTDMGRGKRLLLSAAFAIPVVAGAAFSYLVLRDLNEDVQIGALVFTAGVLATVTVEEIVPEAHSEEESRLDALAFVLGFAGFALLSQYLG